jgi:CRISPR-associated exonuclease Cas4
MFGNLMCGGGRSGVELGEAQELLELAGQIRAAHANVRTPIPVNPKPGQCRPCGMRGHCGQARL